MSRLVILALRLFLALLAFGALGAQIVIIVLVALNAPASRYASVVIAYAALGVAALVCLEVALVAVWVLLAMVRRDVIFDERAFRWVTAITVAGLAGALLVAALCMHYGGMDDAPGLVLIGLGVAAAGVAFALLMVVMRGLLRNATTLRRELDEVV